MTSPCKSKHCLNEARRRGYCRLHYDRLMRSGQLAPSRATRHTWTDEEQAKLRLWHEKGISRRVMASQLGVTIQMAKNYAMRMGLLVAKGRRAAPPRSREFACDVLPPVSEGDRCACSLLRDERHPTCDLEQRRQEIREGRADAGSASISVRSKAAS